MKNRHQTRLVVTPTKVKAFIDDTVNLPNPVDHPDHAAALTRWLSRWQRAFTFRVDGEEGLVSVADLSKFAPIARTTLRRIWDEGDLRRRDWYCFRLRDVQKQMLDSVRGWSIDAKWDERNTVSRYCDRVYQDAPEPNFFDAAVCWAQLHGALMKVCSNSTCEAPYFFRNERSRAQRYCSQDCANVVRRSAKLKWWNENRRASRE